MATMIEVPQALAALARYPQWILWRSVPKADGGTDKVPIDPRTGAVASALAPSTQTTAAEAMSRAAAQGLGVGFVFQASDPFFFLDIDHALQPDGSWSPLAVMLCRRFEGCAIEISQSGTGLHIIGTGAPGAHRCRNIVAGLELYHEGRFVALTGQGAQGDAGFDASEPLTITVDGYFAPQEGLAEDVVWTEGPADGYTGPQDDDQLLAMAMRSTSAAGSFGGKATFRQLWEADGGPLALAFPGPQGFDHSSADSALMSHLAFWTGRDAARMDRLFRRSGLMRDKYNDRPDYRTSTIKGALGLGGDFYTGTRRAQLAPPATAPGPAGTPGDPQGQAGTPGASKFLTVADQIGHFAGCVYVRDQHRIYISEGALLGPEQFKAHFGGWSYALDGYNEKIARSAWDAFIDSRGHTFPKVASTCFRPERPPGEIIHEEGQALVNIYVPVETPIQEGDPGPFLDHVSRLIPSEIDRGILLAYMAAMVQYPGTKFQWAPVLQGVEGNGKTLFIRALSYAIGSKYTHLPNAADIGNKFNAWILGKLFIGIEEVNVGDKQEILDTLKPLITNDRVDIQGKGLDQKTGDNRANFFLCSNHKMAVRKTVNDRRYAVIYTAQQQASDLTRDGINNGYFPQLYGWARAGGYAIINNYLRTYAIPDHLNPATGSHRAPLTTSTTEAIAVSQGGLEQEIQEAAEEGRPGFAGGWVSSMALDRLLSERRRGAIFTPHKRKEVLEALGYVQHPGLAGGRVASNIGPEGGKPRLYIQATAAETSMRGSAEISRAYQTAQGWPTGGD